MKENVYQKVEKVFFLILILSLFTLGILDLVGLYTHQVVSCGVLIGHDDEGNVIYKQICASHSLISSLSSAGHAYFVLSIIAASFSFACGASMVLFFKKPKINLALSVAGIVLIILMAFFYFETIGNVYYYEY
jgi:hypothetical protein